MSNTLWALLLLGIWTLVVLGRRSTLRARRESKTETFRHHFINYSTWYLVPIGLIMTFYVGLAFYIQLFRDRVSIGWLMNLQLTLERTSAFFHKYFVFNQAQVLVFIVVIYLLHCAVLLRKRRRHAATPPIEEKRTPAIYRVIERYNRYAVAIGVCLALLASFTFFGRQVGVPARDLALRLKSDQDGFAVMTQKAEAELAQQVTEELLIKVESAFPKSYVDALDGQYQVDVQILELNKSVEALRLYGMTDPDLDSLLAPEVARIGGLNRTVTWFWVGVFTETDQSSPALPQGRSPLRRLPTTQQPQPLRNTAKPSAVLTESTHSKVETAAESWAGRPEPKAVIVITSGSRIIMLQVAKVVMEGFTELAKLAAQEVPLAEPLLTAFAESVDRGVQQRLELALDRILANSLRQPGDLQSVVDREAAEIVRQTEVSEAVRRATPRAEQAAKAATELLPTLEARKTQLTAAVADKAIADLSSPSRDIVSSANGRLDGLSFAGYQLSKAQVDRLVSILDSGTRKWSESYRPPGRHCTDVTTTSVRFYAASVLLRAKSPHIDQPLRNRCTQVLQTDRTTVRNSDPGWICFG